MKMGSRLTDLISKKKTNCTCSSLFLLMISKKQIFPCRCFARLQRCFVWLKRQTSIVTHYFYGGTVVCAYPIFCFLCSCWLLFFTAAHFLNFHVFFLRNSSPLFSITRSSSFSIFHDSVNIKNRPKKTRLCCCFFFSGGHVISFQIKPWVAPADWVILNWYACGADERSLARCTVTRLTNFLGWVVYHNSLAMELRAWSSAISLPWVFNPEVCQFN